MATINVPEDVLAGLQARAEAEDKTVEELVEEVLRASVKPPSWEELLAYGQERGRASGYTEEQVPDVVHDWRRAQRP
ncbi:MAG: ribbon-helix-helix protein, CopG family [Bryobacteraceae bacterium]